MLLQKTATIFLFSFFLLLLISCFLPNTHPFLSGPPPAFVFNSTSFPRDEEYNYIAVGGGTAGCPLAATLSQDLTVLLLERGASGLSFPTIMTPDGFLVTLMHTDHKDSPAQAFVSEDGVPNARGRVLGGSSAINVGFYSRADTGIRYVGMKILEERRAWAREQGL